MRMIDAAAPGLISPVAQAASKTVVSGVAVPMVIRLRWGRTTSRVANGEPSTDAFGADSLFGVTAH